MKMSESNQTLEESIFTSPYPDKKIHVVVDTVKNRIISKTSPKQDTRI